jgi:hypothetical protein
MNVLVVTRISLILILLPVSVAFHNKKELFVLPLIKMSKISRHGQAASVGTTLEIYIFKLRLFTRSLGKMLISAVCALMTRMARLLFALPGEKQLDVRCVHVLNSLPYNNNNKNNNRQIYGPWLLQGRKATSKDE